MSLVCVWGPYRMDKHLEPGAHAWCQIISSRSPKISLLKITPGDSFFKCLFPLPATLNSAVLGFSCLKENTSPRKHNVVKLWDWRPPLDYLRYLRSAAMRSGKEVTDWGRKEGETPLHRGPRRCVSGTWRCVSGSSHRVLTPQAGPDAWGTETPSPMQSTE